MDQVAVFEAAEAANQPEQGRSKVRLATRRLQSAAAEVESLCSSVSRPSLKTLPIYRHAPRQRKTAIYRNQAPSLFDDSKPSPGVVNKARNRSPPKMSVQL
jgi:hypothetical protein